MRVITPGTHSQGVQAHTLAQPQVLFKPRIYVVLVVPQVNKRIGKQLLQVVIILDSCENRGWRSGCSARGGATGPCAWWNGDHCLQRGTLLLLFWLCLLLLQLRQWWGQWWQCGLWQFLMLLLLLPPGWR